MVSFRGRDEWFITCPTGSFLLPANASLSRSLMTSVLCSLGLIAQPVLAEQEKSRVAVLEEVIVTAQKREQNLQDVPMAVTAVGRELIENNEINNIQDLTKVVPSVRLTPNDGSPGGGAISVRGVGTFVFSPGVEPNVLVMSDGVPLSRNTLANFDFADIERIEVLRGPQGTLFGKNASAGLIHVITRDPSPEFEARVRASVESHDHWPGGLWKIQGSVSGPLTDDLGLRITGFYKEVDGFYEDIRLGETLPDTESYGIRTKLLWEVSDNVVARLGLEHDEYEGGSTPLVFGSANPDIERRIAPIEPGPENRQTKTFGTNANGENSSIALTLDWDIGWATVTSVTAYREAERLNEITADGIDGDRFDIVKAPIVTEFETFSQELRLTSTSGESIEYTVGAMWFDNWLNYKYDQYINDIPAGFIVAAAAPGLPLPDPGNIFGGADSLELLQYGAIVTTTENIGVFAEVSWHFSDFWHLTVGGRYIYEYVDVPEFYFFQEIRHAATGLPVTSGEVNRTDANVSDTAQTGKASLQYDWGEHSTVYGTISTGYRGRSYDIAPLSAEAGNNSLDNPTKPETVVSYELGIKSRLFDNRLQMNVSVYDSIFSDFQAQLTDLSGDSGIPQTRVANAGELETRGVEVEIMAKPTSELFFAATLLYNRAIFNEFITQCFPGQRPEEEGAIDSNNDGVCDAQDVSGKPLANSPRRSVSLLARYDHLLEGSGQNIYAQLSGRWQDKVQFSNDQHPLTIHDPVSIWDLRLGWISEGGRLEVAGYVKNIFSESYDALRYAFSLQNDRRDYVHNLAPDADRTFGLSAEYQW